MAQYNKSGFETQKDSLFADNSNGDIDAADIAQMFEHTADSVAFTADTNTFSESNIFGEIDHTQVFGATGFDAYDNTNEVAPTVHIYCDDQYALAFENIDNVDADTKRYCWGQRDGGDFAMVRISESGGTDTANTVFTVDQNDLMSISGLVLTEGSELTISSGAVTASKSYHTVDTESDAASDDLDTINGGVTEGQILVLRGASGARTVTLKDGVDNLQLTADFALDSTRDSIGLMWIGSLWVELFRSNNN